MVDYDLCDKPVDDHHPSSCTSLLRLWVRRHYTLCQLFRNALPKTFQGKIGGRDAGNQSPDLVSADGAAVDLEIGARKHGQRSCGRKIAKYTAAYRGKVCPLVFTTDYTVMSGTLQHIDALARGDQALKGCILRRAATLLAQWNVEAFEAGMRSREENGTA